MKKSEKKIKSDRINALRKQYDAFLEEDKRRKERNEYILGRLDKMRYCTAMVQIRHKPTIDPNRDVYLISSRQENATRISHTNPDFVPLSIPRNPINEKTILQEISRKYILIPKNMPGFDDQFAQHRNTSVEESSDWKSKYDILEKLKHNEKESDNVILGREDISQNNRSFNDEQEQKILETNFKSTGIKNQELLKEYRYKHELPEKEYDTKYKQAINPDQYWDTNNTHQPTEINEPISEKVPEKILISKLNKGLTDTGYHDNKKIANQTPDNEKEEENIYIQQPMSMSKFDDETPEKFTEHEITYVNSDDKPQVENSTYDQYSHSTVKDINSETENIYKNVGDDVVTVSEESITQKNMDIRAASNPQVQNFPEYSNNVVIDQENYIPIQNLDIQDNSNTISNEHIDTVNQFNDTTQQYDPNLEQNLDPHDNPNIHLDEDNGTVDQYNYETTQQYDPNLEQNLDPHDNPNIHLDEHNDTLDQYNYGTTQQYDPNLEQNLDPHDYANIHPNEHIDTVDQYNYDTTQQFDPNSAPIQNPVDTSGMDAFDTEETAMLQTDQTDQNYAYNQEGVANTYNQEYMSQNETYQENRENAYYAGADAEQVYSAEINEHEQVAQQYDPNYEQQYGVFESQEQQEYEQGYAQSQEYETEIVNDQEFNQPQFEQHHDTQEIVEQQQSNIENQNEHVEVSNVEKLPSRLQAE